MKVHYQVQNCLYLLLKMDHNIINVISYDSA